jgi:hypothetical protein
MSIATGIAKKVAYKKQSALGTIAATSGAQYLRRISSNVDLKKATYQSTEMRSDMQRADMRHGVRSVDGTISGELSPGSYADFLGSVLRQAWQSPATTGAVITVAAAVTTGASGTFTRSAGSYFTDGFKIGDVVRWTGWATTGVPNNAHNFLITTLTATIMTGVMLDGVAVGAKVAGDSVTCAVKGKKNFVPATGHLREYYTIEHVYSDITQSEVFTDCAITQANIKMPASGMNTIDFPIMGLNMVPGTAAYFTTPTAAVGTGVTAAANGAIYVGGAAVGLITGLDFTINGNFSTPGGVVGSDVEPDIFQGAVDVTGNMTVYFQDAVFRDYFVNETEVSLVAVFTTANTPTADFVGFTMSRVKAGGASKDDGDKGLVMTMPFTALLNTAGGAGTANEMTTISIQDSTLT